MEEQTESKSVNATGHDPAESDHLPWTTAVKLSLQGHPFDCTRGRLGRSILLLAVPMVLETVMESVFAVCDIFFVSRLGDEAVAAVGLTESMLTLFYAVAIGLAMSATAMVARRIGERNVDGAVRAATQAVAVSLTLGLLLGIPCLLYGSDLLRLMGAEQGVIEAGGSYTQLMLGGNVVILLLFLNNPIFRGAGDTMTPTWLNLFCFWFGQIPLALLLARSGDLGPSSPLKNCAMPRRALAADLRVAQDFPYPPIRRILCVLISTTIAPPVHDPFFQRAVRGCSGRW